MTSMPNSAVRVWWVLRVVLKPRRRQHSELSLCTPHVMGSKVPAKPAKPARASRPGGRTVDSGIAARADAHTRTPTPHPLAANHWRIFR
jgi:hypothetical protein